MLVEREREWEWERDRDSREKWNNIVFLVF